MPDAHHLPPFLDISSVMVWDFPLILIEIRACAVLPDSSTPDTEALTCAPSSLASSRFSDDAAELLQASRSTLSAACSSMIFTVASASARALVLPPLPPVSSFESLESPLLPPPLGHRRSTTR